MIELPSWLPIAIGGVVPAIAIIGFWTSLASRLTKAELLAEESHKEAESTHRKLSSLCAEFAAHKEKIAGEYINRETMLAVEDRVTQAINRLGDRLDRLFERQKNDS